jgi:tetratricopeptide (TPR) repeat protein
MFESDWVSRAVAIGGPAAATLYLSFNAGGFFAGSPAFVAAVLGMVLALRLMIAERPFAGVGAWLGVAVCGLAMFAVWALVSNWWSHAPARAMVGFDRALLYCLAMLLFGSFGRNSLSFRWATTGIAGALVGIATVALVTRLLPDLWSAHSSVQGHRLSYPLTYWNALGIQTAVGIIICVHLSSDGERSPLERLLAAAALPILAATLYFTFSRGSIAVVFVGLAIYALVGRPRRLISTALAALPTVAVAIVACYGADLLATGHYASAAGVVEGHHVAWAVALSAVGAGLIRLAAEVVLDPRLEAVRVVTVDRRRVWAVGVPLTLAVIVLAAVAFDLPHRASEQLKQFTNDTGASSSGDLRNRLTSFSNNGRIAQWRVALDDGFAPHPLTGTGADTYVELWAEKGVPGLKVVNTHSLYLEALSDLGIPGLLFLLAGFLALLGGLIRALRGPDRLLVAALLAASSAWMLHAAADWDWQMPATVFWMFALGAMALARPLTARSWQPARVPRLAMAIGALALIVSPVLIALSQARIDSAVAELKKGDCAAASSDALSAVHLVSARPEPYQLLGFCDSRVGQHQLAIQMLQTAVDEDPKNWESFYGLALVEGAAEQDPRPAAREALRLAPNEPLVRNIVARFRTADPQAWRRRAIGARLPIF